MNYSNVQDVIWSAVHSPIMIYFYRVGQKSETAHTHTPLFVPAGEYCVCCMWEFFSISPLLFWPAMAGQRILIFWNSYRSYFRLQIVDYTSEYAWHFSPYKLLSNLNASKVIHCQSENFKQILTSFLCVAANGAIWRKSSWSLSKTYFNTVVYLLVYLASLLKSVLK
jgi:hypothetical protein